MARTASESPSAGGRRSVWLSTVGGSDSARQFGEEFNVHAWALPFAGHVIDPMHILTEVGAFLRGRPDYCQRVTKNPLQKNIDCDDVFWENTILMNKAMLTHGWWYGGKSSLGRYYCNPRYCHRHPGSDIFEAWDDRYDFLEEAAAIGSMDPRDVAPAFGIQASTPESAGNSVTAIAYRCEFPWKERRHAGRHRLIRTWGTLVEWGYSKAAISRAFGVSRPTVSKWLSRTEFDQELPGDPTCEVVECL